MAMIVLQGKVLPEVLNQFKLAQDNSDCETFNKFVEELLEAYLNPKTKQVEVPRPTAEQLQEIQLKENEIGREKTAYSLLEEKYRILEENSAITQNLLSEYQSKITVDGKVFIADDQVLLTIPPVISHVLKIEQETAKKKSGKEFGLGDILLNNFWESIVNGASYPFRIWTRSELAKLVRDLKEKE